MSGYSSLDYSLIHTTKLALGAAFWVTFGVLLGVVFGVLLGVLFIVRLVPAIMRFRVGRWERLGTSPSLV